MAGRNTQEASFGKIEVGRTFFRQPMREETEEARKLNHKHQVKIGMYRIHGIQPTHGMMQEIEQQRISFFFPDGFVNNFVQEKHDGVRVLLHVTPEGVRIT